MIDFPEIVDEFKYGLKKFDSALMIWQSYFTKRYTHNGYCLFWHLIDCRTEEEVTATNPARAMKVHAMLLNIFFDSLEDNNSGLL